MASTTLAQPQAEHTRPSLGQFSYGSSSSSAGRATSDYGGKARQGHDEEGRTQVFIGNLPFRVRWQDLKDLFRNAGNVLRADVTLLPDNRSKGTGTVLFPTREEALMAIEMYNGFIWQNRPLDVHLDVQDPTGAIAMVNTQHQGPSSHGGTPQPQMVSIPMMHFMAQQSNWQHGLQPGGLSTSPPSSVSRPGSSAGAHGLTPATSPGATGEKPTSNDGATAASQSPDQHHHQAGPFGGPNNYGVLPMMMMPPGSGPPGAQFVAMPQLGYNGGMPGGLVAYYAQAYRPSPIPPAYANRHLFVGNLPFNCQWQDLKDLFRTAGNILRADITTGPDGRSRGFGTVLFATADDAQNAVRMFNGYEYNGRPLKVHHDKFAGQQHPSHHGHPHHHGHGPAPPMHHRSSAPVMPTMGFAPPLGHTGSQAHVPQINGMHDRFGSSMQREGSNASASAIPSASSAGDMQRPSSAAHAHLPNVHGAIHPPHPLSHGSAEPTVILGPSALMSPGPAQTGDLHAFAAAAGHYGHGHFSSFGPPGGHQYHAQHQAPGSTADSEGSGQARSNEVVSTPDEHPGNNNAAPPFFGPLSPQQGRGVSMTPSMPGFSFHPFPQTPPLLPQFLSPGLGPFSPPLGTPHGHHPSFMNAAPGAPIHYGMGTPTNQYAPSYFPSVNTVMGHPQPGVGYEAPVPPTPTNATSSGPAMAAAEDAGGGGGDGETTPAQDKARSPELASSPPQPATAASTSLFVPAGSALAARRASYNAKKEGGGGTSDTSGHLSLTPTEVAGPSSNSSGSDSSPPSSELAARAARLDLSDDANANDPAPRRASFLDSTLRRSGGPSVAERRKRFENVDDVSPTNGTTGSGSSSSGGLAAPSKDAPRRSSFDGAAAMATATTQQQADAAKKPKRAFGQSIWQL